MGRGKTKDRTARWSTMEHLLYQYGKTGITVTELASKCGVSTRQIYRDLKDLESKVDLKLWQDGKNWGVNQENYLPPIRFTLPEALNIFLATRLMLRFSNRFHPQMTSTFIKLNSIIPSPLSEQIQSTLDWMQQLPYEEKHQRVFTALAEGWASHNCVKINYRALPAEKATERLICPYLIEPAAPGHSSYVLAHCRRANDLRIFKVERIEKAEVTSEPYTMPKDFNANRYLSGAWGIVVNGELQTVRLKFTPEIGRLMEETIWHPSQIIEKTADNSVIMTLRVFETYELSAWILGWGGKVEVLEPKELRKEIASTAKDILAVYEE